MLKKELAQQLGVSESMVSRHAKQGMPTDSLERAQRWRKRHLEPGRIKGQRYDPKAKKAVQPAGAGVALPPHGGALGACVSALTQALADGQADSAADLQSSLRELLRTLPTGVFPAMPLRVWIALVDYALHDDADVRRVPHLDSVVDADRFAALVRPGMDWMAAEWVSIACDWSGHSVTGLPVELEDA